MRDKEADAALGEGELPALTNSEARMGDLLLAPNGIGHGHLTRSLLISSWLREAGRKPLVALQGESSFSAPSDVPSVNIPTLYKLPHNDAQTIANRLADCALMTGDGILFEDTFPAPVSWPDQLRRLVVIQPWSLEYMRLLRHKYASHVDHFLICDHPDSPTWPYDVRATREVLAWKSWSCVGPIYRQPQRHTIATIRSRYQLDPSQRTFVFSMGGGGEQPGSGDRLNFLKKAVEIAEQLMRLFERPRLIFVKGPLFPASIAVPELFEAVDIEPSLPTLIHIADGAIIRPGFNVTWECIAGGTPIVAIPGTTYLEPVNERLVALERAGILMLPASEDRKLEGFLSTAFADGRDVVSRFDGSPVHELLTFVRGLADRPALARTRSKLIYDDARAQVSWELKHNNLLLRIDDVTSQRRLIAWLAALLRDLELFASLEIIPYLCEISNSYLDRVDPDRNFEISQHGYAHLAEYGEIGYGEYARSTSQARCHVQLALGKRTIQKMFADRFRGGFSAPYDALASHVASTWCNLGGKYISWIRHRPAGAPLSTVQIGVDVWDWQRNVERPPTELHACVAALARTSTTVGLVLHMRQLEERSHRHCVAHLLTQIRQGGAVSRHISESLECEPKQRLHNEVLI